MLILVIMVVGIVIGYKFLPEKYYKLNSRLQLACTILLIFAMGVTLGQRENFKEEILGMGLDSLLLAVLPMIGSALLVYGLTTWAKKKGQGK